NYYIVDRLFAAAELRLGSEHQATVRISRTDGTTMTSSAEEGGVESERVAAMRLRSERPRVTRLSRKVLAGGTAIGLITIFGAVLWALQNNRTRTVSSGELYSTDHHNVADGLSGLPRDYAGVPRQAP